MKSSFYLSLSNDFTCLYMMCHFTNCLLQNDNAPGKGHNMWLTYVNSIHEHLLNIHVYQTISKEKLKPWAFIC